MKKNMVLTIVLAIMLCCFGCKETHKFSGSANEVKLITLDPGHFHAAQYRRPSPFHRILHWRFGKAISMNPSREF